MRQSISLIKLLVTSKRVFLTDMSWTALVDLRDKVEPTGELADESTVPLLCKPGTDERIVWTRTPLYKHMQSDTDVLPGGDSYSVKRTLHHVPKELEHSKATWGHTNVEFTFEDPKIGKRRTYNSQPDWEGFGAILMRGMPDDWDDTYRHRPIKADAIPTGWDDTPDNIW